MRALWSDRQNCSHNVSQKVKRIRRLSESSNFLMAQARLHPPSRDGFGIPWTWFDEGQITHLICARIKYDLYDIFRGCFGPASCSFSCRKSPTAPPKKVI